MTDGTKADDSEAWHTLGERLRAVRLELYGHNGVDELAQLLSVAPQVWRNVEEIGELITPAQMLDFVELTGANPVWLLRGNGPRYRLGREPRNGRA